MTGPIHRRLFLHQTIVAGAGICLAGPGASARDRDDQEFTLADFEKLHKQLQPAKDELWRTIPWKMEIVGACNRAAKEKKPLVLRVRSGHPLGCV